MICVEYRRGALSAIAGRGRGNPIPAYGTRQQFICCAGTSWERWEFQDDEKAHEFIKECQEAGIKIKIIPSLTS